MKPAHVLALTAEHCAAGLGQDSMLLYNNLLAFPLMVVYMVVATSELQEIRFFPQLDDPLFLVGRWPHVCRRLVM